MIGKSDHKVPGGKLLRVEIGIDGESGLISRAFVRGDFFAHPEEAFERAEAALVGLPSRALGEAARSLFAEPPLQLFGVSPGDIAQALEEARLDAQAH